MPVSKKKFPDESMMMTMMMMILMMNCFCGMVDRRMALCLISRLDHCPTNKQHTGYLRCNLNLR